MPDNSKIQNILDPLAKGYKQLEKSTLLEASEIMNLRRTSNHELKDNIFLPANISLYRFSSDKTLEYGENFEYGIAGKSIFETIAGDNIDEFTKQIIDRKIYRLTPDQIKSISESDDIAWALGTKENLRLWPHDWEDCYIYIKTEDYNAENLNDSQKTLVTKVFGSLDKKQDPNQELSDYGENMRMLNKSGHLYTILVLPTPAFVHTHNLKRGPFAMASLVLNLNYDYRFIANHKDIDRNYHLRGVLKK